MKRHAMPYHASSFWTINDQSGATTRTVHRLETSVVGVVSQKSENSRDRGSQLFPRTMSRSPSMYIHNHPTNLLYYAAVVKLRCTTPAMD